MRIKIIPAAAAAALLAVSGGAAAVASAGSSGSSGGGPSGPSGGSPSAAATATPSRLDDGRDLLSQSKITEQQAIDAAQGAANGGLNEVDLEHYGGRLVWNVDVGSHDVKVDAGNGDVVASKSDD
jgi:uncharacterized membrane protein YkoI